MCAPEQDQYAALKAEHSSPKERSQQEKYDSMMKALDNAIHASQNKAAILATIRTFLTSREYERMIPLEVKVGILCHFVWEQTGRANNPASSPYD